jgi:hypothetical protein
MAKKWLSRFRIGSRSLTYFKARHHLLEQAYAPMPVLDFLSCKRACPWRARIFSDEALKAAEKGLNKLFKANKSIEKIKPRTGAPNVRHCQDLFQSG